LAGPRVDLDTLHKSKKEGGLGLISVSNQVKCLLAKFILWVIVEGTHPLQLIIRYKLQELSYKKWGMKDLSWVFNTCNAFRQQGSRVWNNMIAAWSKIKKCTQLQELKNEEVVRALPL
jgi:hypothetical protein